MTLIGGSTSHVAYSTSLIRNLELVCEVPHRRARVIDNVHCPAALALLSRKPHFNNPYRWTPTPSQDRVLRRWLAQSCMVALIVDVVTAEDVLSLSLIAYYADMIIALRVTEGHVGRAS